MKVKQIGGKVPDTTNCYIELLGIGVTVKLGRMLYCYCPSHLVLFGAGYLHLVLLCSLSDSM